MALDFWSRIPGPLHLACSLAFCLWMLAEGTSAEEAVTAGIRRPGTSWRFLAVDSDKPQERAALSLDDSGWDRLSFPNKIWSERFSEREGRGWYRCRFEVSDKFKGLDLVIDLGPVDDVDVTYLNGSEIGRTGRTSEEQKAWESAWNVPRRYRAPASLVRWGSENVLAVRVYSRSGMGGILREPAIGLALPARSATWNVRRGADVSPLSGPHGGTQSVDEPVGHWLKPQIDAAPCWQEHVLEFSFAASIPEAPVILDLGYVPGPDETSLNGQRIGSTGLSAKGGVRALLEEGGPALRTSCSTDGAAPRARRTYLVPPGLLRRGQTNTLLVRTSALAGPRSLPCIPMLRVEFLGGIDGAPQLPPTDSLSWRGPSSPRQLPACRRKSTPKMSRQGRTRWATTGPAAWPVVFTGPPRFWNTW